MLAHTNVMRHMVHCLQACPLRPSSAQAKVIRGACLLQLVLERPPQVGHTELLPLQLP